MALENAMYDLENSVFKGSLHKLTRVASCIEVVHREVASVLDVETRVKFRRLSAALRQKAKISPARDVIKSL